MANVTYPDGLLVKYTYDNLGRVATVSKTGTTYASFSYFTNDGIKGIQFGNGLVQNYTYDSLSRISSINVATSRTTFLSLTYTYNKTQTVASVTGQVNGATVNEQYRYDPLGRLTNATVTSGTATSRLWYQYDNVGNRIKQSVNGTITRFSYNSANNELSSSSATGVTTTYSYDQNGNLLAKNITTTGTVHWTYLWDISGRLLKANKDGAAQGLYAYDGDGRRVESTESATTTFYGFMGINPLYEKTLGGTSTDYIYANGLRLAKVTGTTNNYYHTDGLGSTRLVTDSSSKVKVLFADNYQPFGQDNGIPTGSEKYRFAGEPYSSTTGLFYDNQRWYDASVGRFISTDPALGYRSNPQSLNPYIYVVDSPTTGTDPYGLSCLDSVSSFFGCAGGDIYDSTVGAVINTVNWYNSASPGDQRAFWLGVFTAVAIGVLIGVTCLVAACSGLLLLIAIGVGTGFVGSVAAADVYHAAGGSDAGLQSVEFAGGLGAGLGFSLGMGPLGAKILESADLRLAGDVEASFIGKAATKIKLEDDLTIYQYGNGEGWSGHWATFNEYGTSAEARAGLSLPDYNSGAFVRQVTIPKGTNVWMGFAEKAWDQPGGGTQIFVRNIARIKPGIWMPLIPA